MTDQQTQIADEVGPPEVESGDELASRAESEALAGGGQLRSSVVMLLITGIQVGTSALFWLVAARVESEEAVGQASALFVWVQFVNFVTGLGLPVTLARYSSTRGLRSDGVLSWALALTAATSVVGGSIFLVIRSAIGDSLGGGWDETSAMLGRGVVAPLVFGIIVATISVGMLVDIRLLQARRFAVLVVKTALIGLSRFPLLALRPSGVDAALWQFAVAVAPMMVWGVVGPALLPRLLEVSYHLKPKPAAWREVAAYSKVNYIATLASEAPNFTVPVMVSMMVAPSVTANYFVANTASGVLFLVPATLSTVVLTEGARAGGQIDHRRPALKLSLAVTTFAFLASLVGSSLVVTVYGDGYAQAARLLPYFVFASIPWAWAANCLAEARVRRDHNGTMLITGALGIGVLGLSFVLIPLYGPAGAAAAWIVGTVAAAAVAFYVDRRARIAGRDKQPATAG